jgi:protein-S-isoprenylcysteine O-methyltransferase Ste14
MVKTLIRCVGAVVVGGAALALTSLDQNPRIVIGIVTGLPSFVLMIVSRRQLGKSFAVVPQATALVTTGLYAWIQHPLYLFLDLFLLSVLVVIGSPALFVAWVILVGIQVIQSRREERILAAAFGAEYSAYEARTWI